MEQAAVTTPVSTRLTPSALVRALRPDEWVKTLFVFAALLFGGQFDLVGARGHGRVRCVLRRGERGLPRQRHPRHRARPAPPGEALSRYRLGAARGRSALGPACGRKLSAMPWPSA